MYPQTGMGQGLRLKKNQRILVGNYFEVVRSVAFLVTEYNEVLTGHQPGQVVE
jgi:hypothetical protein